MMQLKMSKETRGWIVYFFGIWNLAGFAVGIGEGFVARHPISDPVTSGCIYESILAFTNPGHLIGCELVRKRWSIE